MVEILRGDVLAAAIELQVGKDVDELVAGHGVTPTLAVVLVGGDAPSRIYVERKKKAASRVGICSLEFRLPGETQQAELLELIGQLNNDPAVHGILVQLPLPAHIASDEVLNAIAPSKDVDGFHPVNVGRLSTGSGGLVPCTPLGCMLLLDQVVSEFKGLSAVVIGKSNIVGKPVALLLLERECTVTVTHIHTIGLPEITRKADILVVAAGSPGLVRGSWVKPGAVVIDVGINRIVGADGNVKIVGDVAGEGMDHVGVLTPVPQGVGPMTIACLLTNTIAAAKSSLGAAAGKPDFGPSSFVDFASKETNGVLA